MVRVLYVENSSKISSHQDTADRLGFKNQKTCSIKNSKALIELVNKEKPQLLIIDDRFTGLKETKTLKFIANSKDIIVILIERVNGTRRIRELKHIAGGLKEGPISEKELLEKVSSLKLKSVILSAS